MLLAVLSALFALLGLACVAVVLAHAFRRSLGTGVMVLLIPAYVVLYAFTQFEHRRKGLLVAGLLASTTLSGILYGLGVAQLLPPVPPLPPGP